MGLNRAGAGVPAFQSEARQTELSHRQQPWYAAYMAALFEPSRDQMSARVRQAEQLIFARERELLGQQPGDEERALNNALHALRALASCLNL